MPPLNIPFTDGQQLHIKVDEKARETSGEEERVPFLDSDLVFPVQRKTHRPSILLITAFIAFTAICSFLTFRIGVTKSCKGSTKTSTYPQTAGIKDKALQLPLRTQLFEYDEIFAEAPSDVTDDAWSSLIPRGRGFISLQKWYDANMSETQHHEHGASKPSSDEYCIAVFHQLHCLYMLRDGFYSNEVGGESMHHVKHCFDYLRQNIMCSADGALEPYSKDLEGVDGWGTVRQCRDYSVAYKWAEKYKSNDNTGIM